MAKISNAARAYIKELFGDKLAAQPIQTLVNVAQPDESRILKSPLPVSAGGWGQIANGYTSTKDARYTKMLKLVMNCTPHVIPTPKIKSRITSPADWLSAFFSRAYCYFGLISVWLD
jgi:hypothetical protein